MFSIKQRASQDPVLSLFLCWAAGIAGYSFNRRLLLGNGCIKESFYDFFCWAAGVAGYSFKICSLLGSRHRREQF